MSFPQTMAVVVGMSAVFAGRGIVAQTTSNAAGVDLSAVPFNISLEGAAQQPIKIEIKRAAGTGETVAILDEMKPGPVMLDLSFLDTDFYFVYVHSPGYATGSYRLDVRGGKAYRLPNADTLCRKRYAIIRYAVNRAGKRNLEGADVEQGRFAASQDSPIPHLGTDWLIVQVGQNLAFHYRLKLNGHGVARAAEGASFEQLTEAPPPDAYRAEYVNATRGLILFFRKFGMTANDEYYLKVLVEDITETPPADELGKVSSILSSTSASKTNTSSQTRRPQSDSSVAASKPVAEQGIVSPLSAVPFRIALEDNATGTVRLSIKRYGPRQPPAGKLEDVQPGKFTLDLSWLEPDAYLLFASASGYASEHFELEVKNGEVTLPTDNVTLFRKRYAIIRYSINTAGKRTLDGLDLEQGRYVAHAGSGLIPFLGTGCSAVQRSRNLFLDIQLGGDFHGIAEAPTGTPFEQLTEALLNDAYHHGTTRLTTGLILFFRTYKDERYGKLLVEGITESPPADMKILDSVK